MKKDNFIVVLGAAESGVGKGNTVTDCVSGRGSGSIPICTRNVSGCFIRLGQTVTDDYGSISQGRRYTGNQTVLQRYSVGLHGTNRTGTDGRISAYE